MTVMEAKDEYNKQLKRFTKANEYFDRVDVPYEEKEKFLPHFQQLLENLNYLLGKIGVYTSKEVLEGFHE